MQVSMVSASLRQGMRMVSSVIVDVSCRAFSIRAHGPVEREGTRETRRKLGNQRAFAAQFPVPAPRTTGSRRFFAIAPRFCRTGIVLGRNREQRRRGNR